MGARIYRPRSGQNYYFQCSGQARRRLVALTCGAADEAVLLAGPRQVQGVAAAQRDGDEAVSGPGPGDGQAARVGCEAAMTGHRQRFCCAGRELRAA